MLKFSPCANTYNVCLPCFVAKAPNGKAIFGVTYPVAALGAMKCTTLAATCTWNGHFRNHGILTCQGNVVAYNTFDEELGNDLLIHAALFYFCLVILVIIYYYSSYLLVHTKNHFITLGAILLHGGKKTK